MKTVENNTPLLFITTVVKGTFVNASPPMDVTKLGIVIEVNNVQPLKTQTPILVTVLGIVIDDNDEQYIKNDYQWM